MGRNKGYEMIDINKLLNEEYYNKGIKLFFYKKTQMMYLHGYCYWISPIKKIIIIDKQLIITGDIFDYFYNLDEIKKYKLYELKGGK
jgi:hypothetical protein